MRDAAAIIDALGGSIQVAAAIGKPVGTVSAWKTRQSIPCEYWLDLVSAAARIGRGAVTLEALATAHTPKVPCPAIAAVPSVA